MSKIGKWYDLIPLFVVSEALGAVSKYSLMIERVLMICWFGLFLAQIRSSKSEGISLNRTNVQLCCLKTLEKEP